VREAHANYLAKLKKKAEQERRILKREVKKRARLEQQQLKKRKYEHPNQTPEEALGHGSTFGKDQSNKIDDATKTDRSEDTQKDIAKEKESKNLANNMAGEPQEAENNNAFQQQNKLNLSLNMNAFLSGLQFNNEAQGINDSNFRGVGDGNIPRANMDYNNMADNLNFINLQSRIYDMHNIMRQLGNLEGE